jgi:WD40 repeat protein
LLANLRWVVLTAAATLLVGGSVALGAWYLWAKGPSPAEPLRRLTAPVEFLNRVCYSADGKLLAAGGATGDVVVWEAASAPRPLEKLSTDAITALALSTTGFLTAGTAERTVVGWQLLGPSAGKVTRKLPNFPAPISACAAHPQRSDVMIGLTDGSLYHFGTESQPKRIDSRHAGGVKSICFSPDGEAFVTGGTDGRLIWRDAASLGIRAAIRPHRAEVSGLAFSPDGKLLASGDYNGQIFVHDVEDKRRRFEFAQPEAVSGLAVFDSLLLTGSWDGKLRCWSISTGTAVSEVVTGQLIQDLAIDAQARTVATVHGTDQLLLWQIPRP